MGNLEQIDILEDYIEDFGKELSSIKKASDYLKQIESFQEEVTRTTEILNESKEDIFESKEIMLAKINLFQESIEDMNSSVSSIDIIQQELKQDFHQISNKHQEKLKYSQEVIDALSVNVIDTNSKVIKHQELLESKLTLVSTKIENIEVKQNKIEYLQKQLDENFTKMDQKINDRLEENQNSFNKRMKKTENISFSLIGITLATLTLIVVMNFVI